MKWPLLGSGLLVAAFAACNLVLPVLIGYFITAIQEKADDGWKWAAIIAVVKLASNVSDQLQQHIGWRLGQRVRATIIAAVYRAALVAAPAGTLPGSDTPSGDSPPSDSSAELLNLVSNDAQKLLEVTPLIHQAWAAPVMILVAAAMLLVILGPAALAGIATFVVLAPLNVAVLKRFNTLRGQHLQQTDERVTLLSEAIRSMRMIKYFAWERPLYQALSGVRDAELAFVGKELSLFAVNISLMITFPVWATSIGLSIYALGNNLTASNAFTALLYFAVLRFPLQQLGMVSAAAVQARVALRRLQTVMQARQVELAARATAAEQAGAQVQAGSALPGPQAVGTFPAQGAFLLTRGNGAYQRWIPRNQLSELRTKLPEPSTGAVPETNAQELQACLDAATPDLPDSPAIDVRSAVFAWTADPQSAPEDPIVEAATSVPAQLSRGHSDGSDAGSGHFSVRDLSLQVYPGQLLAVVGPVGAGKSTLVAGLLGECWNHGPAPTVVRGGLAYVPQTAWIMNASVRDNITFGRPMNPAAYRAVLWASALVEDLQIMPGGDETVIGELGVTLSGGQQQRCSLARAAYACLVPGASPDEPRATVLLADDPLSALDAHTGATVFQRMFSKHGLLRGTVRVLVTHAIQYVPHATTVLALRQGRTVCCQPFAGLAASVAAELQGGAPTQRAADLAWLQESVLDAVAEAGGHGAGTESVLPESPTEDTAPDPPLVLPTLRDLNVDLTHTDDAALMTEEEQRDGNVTWEVLMAWVKAGGGGGTLVAIIAVLVLERASFVLVDWWLANWTSAADGVNQRPLAGMPVLTESSRRNYYVPGYLLLTLVMTAFVVLRCLSWAWVGSIAARSLQDGMLKRILRAPVSFFDTTPAGRIISRCSHDVEVVDFILVRNLMAAAASVGWMVSGIATMCAVTPLASAVLLPVLVAFFFLQSYARSALRDLQRVDNISRSPITAHLSETLAGGASIRAYGPAACARFVRRADELTDANSSALAALKNVNRWLGIRVDLMSTAITVAVALASWLAREDLPEGLAGLSIMWSFNVTVSLTFFILFGVEAESKLVSVERIQHYTDTVVPEAPLYAPCPSELATPAAASKDTTALPPALAQALVADLAQDAPARPQASLVQVQGEAGTLGVPPAAWPQRGQVEFQDVQLRYRPGLPLALKNMTFSVPPGTHVGICGRTGAGKSSISVALFRLVELAGGSISVDGVPLHTIGLSYLRGQRGGICIVPQAPTLMRATVRENLDRFVEFDDAAIGEALAAVGMLRKCARVSRAAGDTAEATPSPDGDAIDVDAVEVSLAADGGRSDTLAAALACKVEAGGGNFSVGEAQLLCLARALLRRPKVLVMDEASASVDSQTETRLVETVRQRFQGTTVLTIAHRLFTLVHSHRILLLKEGAVLEYDTPSALLADSSSHFSSLVDAMGPEPAASFRAQVQAVKEGGGAHASGSAGP